MTTPTPVPTTAPREAYEAHIKQCRACEHGGAVQLCPEGERLHAAWRDAIPAAPLPTAPEPTPLLDDDAPRTPWHALTTVLLVAERAKELSPDNQDYLNRCVALVREFFAAPTAPAVGTGELGTLLVKMEHEARMVEINWKDDTLREESRAQLTAARTAIEAHVSDLNARAEALLVSRNGAAREVRRLEAEVAALRSSLAQVEAEQDETVAAVEEFLLAWKRHAVNSPQVYQAVDGLRKAIATQVRQ